MADLKTFCIGSDCMDVPSALQAGDNIDITNDVISLINSPALTGTPTTPTNGTPSTNNNQIASTAFVQSAIANRLGGTEQNTLTDSKSVRCATANSWVDGASITINQAGLYLVIATATFVAGSSTGNTGHGLRIYAGSTNIAGTIIPCEFSKETQLVVTTWRYLSANTVLKMKKVCGLAESTAGNTSIEAKLVYKPRT